MATTHGMFGTPEYQCWGAMIDRCTNPKSQAYARYGGRGIYVEPRWLGNFPAFLSDVGYRPGPAFSLDREDNNGPYVKSNVRWVDAKTQNDNRSCSRKLTAFGRTQSLQDWCNEYGINYTTLRARIERHGWPVESALQTPTGSIERSRNKKGQYA